MKKLSIVMLSLLFAASVVIVGCEKKEAPKPVVTPQPAVTPPPPAPAPAPAPAPKPAPAPAKPAKK